MWSGNYTKLTALAIVALVGFGSGGWVMSLKYNDPLSGLGRDLVNWNTDRLLKCRSDDNPKCTMKDCAAGAKEVTIFRACFVAFSALCVLIIVVPLVPDPDRKFTHNETYSRIQRSKN